MSIQQNPFAEVPQSSHITDRAVEFIEKTRFESIPPEAINIGKRCLLDGLALYVAGSDHKSTAILSENAVEQGGKEEALLLGHANVKVPSAIAARVLGTAGHAHDWDDSQVSIDPDHVYGLLTHPTIPSLTAAIVMAQRQGNVDGQEFMLAFLIGFEVECKISEWMFSQHYKRGFHSSGTVGTFGAFTAAAKILGLKGNTLRNGLGIVTSFASGIRCNFGTMTKPLHVGRASENGVIAAILASKGYSADKNALDGPWGYFAVQGGGVTTDKFNKDDFGSPWTIIEPGVSIKPYPCGVLTHPTIDLMIRLVSENDIHSEDIDNVIIRAGSNILNPIRYPIANNHLEAKFSLQAVLSMIALNRKAGKIEFEDSFVQSDAMQAMQKRMQTQFDPEIEAMGFDKMRSSIHIQLNDGSSIEGNADERYRGGPENPLSDDELKDKVRACCEGILETDQVTKLINCSKSILDMDNAADLAGLIQSGREQNLKVVSK